MSDDAREARPDPSHLVRALVAAHRPGQRVEHVTLLGAGTDHVAYLVDATLVVRCATAHSAEARADAVVREARLLRAVARLSPLPVPAPAFVDPAAGCLGYPLLAGVPLLALPVATRAARADAVAHALGAFLAALHGGTEATHEAWAELAAAFESASSEASKAFHWMEMQQAKGDMLGVIGGAAGDAPGLVM